MTRIVSLDPGLATFGLVAIETNGIEHRCRGVDVFTSEPHARQLNSAMADDRVRRTRELQRWLASWLDHVQPSAIAAESMSFPRGAHAIVSISLGWGVLCSELERRQLPLVCAFPTHWRKSLTRSGREEDSHIEAVRRVPSFAAIAGAIPHALQAHALDALGVFCWGVTTDTVRAVLR